MGCSPCGNTFDNAKQFLDFVYKLPPLLEKEISVMKPERQRIWTNMVQKGELPTQIGTNYQKLRVHTPRFRDFNNSELYHSKQERAHGATAAGAANAHCTVGPFTKLNGLGYERQTLEHRRGFFETCDFCVETLWRENVAPEEFFAEYMRGVREQLDDIQERTHKNEFESRSQKVWAIYTPSGKLLQNPANPYDWAPVTSANRVSLPSIEMLYHFADDVLSSYSDYYSVGSIDGEPVYPLIMNSRTKHNLVFKNPGLITMIQYSSMADSLIELWHGPISKIGPFVIFVDSDATRLKVDPVTGAVLEIPHWIPIPAPDGGEMWVEHPEWHSRGPVYHDTISIPRKDSWKKLIRHIPTSIGGVQFGTEISPELELKYINILDKECNPFGWIGNFVASHEYYVEPGVNVAQAPGYMMGVQSGIPGVGNEMLYDTSPECPEEVEVCNTVTLNACPCNGVVSVLPHPTNPALAFFTFSQPFSPAKIAGDTISLTTRTGGVAVMTVETPLTVSSDGLTLLLEAATADLANGPIDPEDYVEVACEVIQYCESRVIGMDDCRSEVTNAVKIRLDKNLKCATPGDLIAFRFKGGYTAHFEVIASNPNTQWYSVRYAAGYGPTDDPEGESDTPEINSTWDLCCDRGMPLFACCVPTVGNACPSCDLSFSTCAGGTVAGVAAEPCCG